MKKRRYKEKRFATDVNHQLSKRIVAEAERTGRGVAVEQLTGSVNGYGFASPNGPWRTPGRSPSSVGFSRTSPNEQDSLLYRSIPRTPRSSAARADGSTRRIDVRKRRTSVVGAASLGMPTTTRPATSRHAVRRAGRNHASERSAHPGSQSGRQQQACWRLNALLDMRS